jgi:transposase InsO family protein
MKSNVKNKSQLAKELGISRGALYYKPKMPTKDVELAKTIRALLIKHPSYGHKRIAMALEMNKKRVLRVMKMFEIKPPRRRAKKPSKPDDNSNPAVQYPNLIKNLCPIAPNIIWVSDFTYIWFQGRFIYLATVVDIFSRRIVGWHISDRHNTSLVKLALEDAFERTGVTPEIAHSDQGSEYTGDEYTELLESKQIRLSFSAKSSPWENGYQESLYAGFKLDLGSVDRFKNLGELVEALHLAVNYYNNERIHSKLRMPPMKFYAQYQQRVNLVVTKLKGDRKLFNKRGT